LVLVSVFGLGVFLPPVFVEFGFGFGYGFRFVVVVVVVFFFSIVISSVVYSRKQQKETREEATSFESEE
jgi:hypothetical protein